ncbi:SE1832 family protein [Jeotgalibacillus aurantiacus]|uniref:SE1832 family protein n=1 Tax=Jeotgalibacillus aurantiacus TaxID=2763266 RepID=UPI001D0B9804|nr:SE1832 family protein [Jeotgalibacillus aurantiacus]
MTNSDISNRIAELKMEYIRAQDDLEKLESVGRDVTSAEKRLTAIEEELSELRKLED